MEKNYKTVACLSTKIEFFFYKNYFKHSLNEQNNIP